VAESSLIEVVIVTAAVAIPLAAFIRSAKQDDIYGASYIVLPCPGSQVIFHLVKDVVIILKSSI
jgi:hypothetical protein